MPTAQALVSPSPQAAAGGKTPRALASQAALAATPVIPAKLPGTGRAGDDPWPAVVLGGLLLALGGYVVHRHRWRRTHRPA